MAAFKSRAALAAALLGGALAPAPAFGQATPRPDNVATCAAGDTGTFTTLPSGTTIGINFPNSLNCGGGSLAGAPGATAVGDHARATGSDSTALGHDAAATAPGATALGESSRATAANATAIGHDANAGFAGSTALGAGATTTAANQVTLGGAGSSVRIGDILASTAAQSGPVGLVTIDAAGTLGVDMASIPAIRRESRQGTAAAVAIGYAPMPSAPGRTSYAFNIATYRGEQAVGGSIMHRLATSVPLAFSAGFSYAGHGSNAARVGIAGEF